MADDVRVALVGVGGYGQTYVRALLDAGAEHGAQLTAAVDPTELPATVTDELAAAGVPIYPKIDALWNGPAAPPELVIVSAPIHYHADFTCAALERGADVLCEKPLTGSVAGAERMIETSRRTGRFVAIGYQWSFHPTNRRFKDDLIAGDFGRALRLKTCCSWPRSKAYYDRNNWAGLVRTADGRPVLDSPANNATAHYLHNMLYVTGPEPQAAARPVELTAELYRAKPTENYDTAALRIRTEAGAEVLFYTSHATQPLRGPVMHFEFERGTVIYDINEDPVLRAKMADGAERAYGNPNVDRPTKIWDCVRAVRSRESVACDARTALAHTQCITAAQDSGTIVDLPRDRIERSPWGDEYAPPDDTIIWMPGLAEALWSCFDAAKLPSELGGLDWARPGETVKL